MQGIKADVCSDHALLLVHTWLVSARLIPCKVTTWQPDAGSVLTFGGLALCLAAAQVACQQACPAPARSRSLVGSALVRGLILCPPALLCQHAVRLDGPCGCLPLCTSP